MSLNCEIEHLTCDCYSDEHTLRYILTTNTHEIQGQLLTNIELTTSVYLNQYRSLFQRIWVALKYIFNYRSRYGDFDCFMTSSVDEVKKIKRLCDEFIKQDAIHQHDLSTILSPDGFQECVSHSKLEHIKAELRLLNESGWDE